MNTTTVHMIGNAHLDPVWLWPWQRGADEAIATCRSACDILDDYPEFIFTRGEAWVHEQVRLIDPTLFERIRAHVKTGRWAVVNGWWVQPDVNLPTEEALRATARLGQRWFREHLGIAEIPVAYNVDSFGHGAYLPRFIRQAGQRYYVMMRPMACEKHLSANLFRWRSPDGHEVLTFRINNAYLCASPDNGHLQHHIQAALNTPRPEGIDHVMCFYGVGNHGGGPTRKLVNWILAHRDFAPGVKLEFSSPARFFAAVADHAERAPVVQEELQYHAIGCYSVCGALKREIRAAELLAADAERLIVQQPQPNPEATRQALDAVWETIVFNQFHDILPGSATSEAVQAARQEIGGAHSRLDRLVYTSLRRDAGLRERPIQGHRLHVVNRAAQPWTGLADVEGVLSPNHHLLAIDGSVVPHQMVGASSLLAESFCAPVPRVLFPVTLQPGEARTMIIADGARAVELPGSAPRFENNVLDNGRVGVEFGPMGIATLSFEGKARLARPLSLVVLADGSDTWSHDVDRYFGPVLALGAFAAPEILETGLLRTAVRLNGTLGGSPARLIVSLDRQAAQVDLRLEVNYREPLTVLKASVALAGGITQRRDRIAGGWLPRPVNGREYPVHHAIQLNDGPDGLTVLFPDSFAADCSTTGSARVTLLRNSIHAYHSGTRLPQEDVSGLRERFGTDEGPQSLRLSLLFGTGEAEAQAALDRLQRPPILWDDFKGISRVQDFE
jgi:alpha-mannosidase